MYSKVDSLGARNKQIDEDFDGNGTFQQQALEIRLPGKGFDPNAAPTTGEEYLTHMAYERRQTPAIVSCRPNITVQKPELSVGRDVKGIYGNEMSPEEIRAFAENSLKMLPTDEWKEIQTKIFETTRGRVNAARTILKSNEDLDLPSFDDSKGWIEYCRQHPPVMKIILNLGQRELELLLELVCEWLHLGEKPPPHIEETPDQEQMTEIDTSQLNLTSRWLGAWLFAIFVCLHLPLEPEVHSSLRDIARVCVRQRGRLTMPDEAKHVLTYNIFIYLIAKAFGQLDFGEFI